MNAYHKAAFHAVYTNLKEYHNQLVTEIDNLDPSATLELSMIAARIDGVLAFMEKEVNNDGNN